MDENHRPLTRYAAVVCHLRLRAARKLGITEIPVILCDEWTPAQVNAFRWMVNRSVTWADWDEDALALELQEIQASDFDLSLTFSACRWRAPRGSSTSTGASTRFTPVLKVNGASRWVTSAAVCLCCAGQSVTAQQETVSISRERARKRTSRFYTNSLP